MSKPAIEFDPGPHVYTCGGILVPNVTTVLQRLPGYENVPARTLREAAARGTAVHIATELDDEGDLDESSLDPQLVPYLDAWRRFRHDHEFEPTAVEQRVFHRKRWYAGTLDREGIIDGDEGIVDIKTTVELMRQAGPQLAAYQEARNYRQARKIKRRWVVQLKRDGTYHLQEHKDPADLAIFLACLLITNWSNADG